MEHRMDKDDFNEFLDNLAKLISHNAKSVEEAVALIQQRKIK